MTDHVALDTAAMNFSLSKSHLDIDLHGVNQGKNIPGRESSQCPECVRAPSVLPYEQEGGWCGKPCLWDPARADGVGESSPGPDHTREYYVFVFYSSGNRRPLDKLCWVRFYFCISWLEYSQSWK